MKKSVLVDFYNLELKSVILRRDIKIPNANGEDTIIHEEDVERIIGFFEIHAPQLLKKLTLEEKKRISELYCRKFRDKLFSGEGLTVEEKQQFGENIVGDFSLYNGEPFFNSFTTLQGFETATGIPWFLSSGYSNFIKHYFKVKVLIDSYLDKQVIPKEQMTFLKSKLNIYMDIHSKYDDMEKYLKNKDNEIVSAIISSIHEQIPQEMGIFTLPLWGLFDVIYSEVMSVLEGKLTIGRCKRKECNNITLKRYCPERCGKTDNKRQKAKKIHEILRDLISQWMKQDEEWFKKEKGITALELKAELEYLVKHEDGWIYIEDKGKYKKNMTEIPFLGTSNASSLSAYLRAPQVHTMLKEIGISVEKKRGTGNINRYHFYEVS